MLARLFRRNQVRIANPANPLAESKRRIAHAICSALEPLEDRTLYSYAAPVSYPAASSTVGMTSVDVNNDGYSDLVTSNSGTNRATVLLGNVDGTFQAAKSSPLGGTPGSSYTGSQAGTLATGDFNGDGKIDLSVISGNNGIILLGNGDGTFQAPVTTYIGTSPSRISTGDVNGDGRADLLTANTVGVVSVSLSNADGTFTKTDYSAGPSTQDVKATDLNHDGKLDLVVANALSAGTVGVLMGNGDGTFQPYHSYQAFSAPYRMTIADMNGDGNDDVVVANSYTSSCITVLYGNGDGTLGTYHSYDSGSQPWELQAADVDGDGKKDLISSNGSTYQIQLNNGDGTFGASTSIAGAGLVFATGDFNHDGVADIAGAGAANVGVMMNNAAAATNISTAVGFSVTAPASATAGAVLPVTVSAIDASGNVVPDFLGTIHISGTDSRLAALTFTFTATDAGTHTISAGISLYTAGAQTINVNGPAGLVGSQVVNVVAAAPTSFAITADAAAVAGSTVSLAVTSQDAFGNFTAGYTGTVHFSSTDSQAGLPADYTFTAADNGVHTFSATMKTAGSQTITATDTLAGTSHGISSPILVSASVAKSLKMIGGGGHIGSSHIVTVTAVDGFGNLASSYNGTVHFTASDAAMQLPVDGALTNGVGQFSVTAMTLGSQTISVSDSTSGISGTETITGTPGDAVKFTMTTVTGGVAGSIQTLKVTAYDAFGNVAVDYSGTVIFSSSDLQATLPFYTFTAADTGSHTFSLVMRTAGSQSLTVRDYYNPVMSSTQNGIIITAGATASITVTPLVGTVAGVAQSMTVTARDSFGNIASGYRGTIGLSSSDTLATMPASYTFTATDAGTHTFSITLKSSGGQTFAVQDTTNAALLFSQRDIQVTASVMTGFAFRAPTNATADAAFTMVLSAVDAYGNTITGYVGKVHFTGPSGGGNTIAADYTFTAADAGSHVFSFTLASTGTQTISVNDLTKTTVKGAVQVTVKASTTSTGGGTTTGGGNTGGGGGGGGGKKVV